MNIPVEICYHIFDFLDVLHYRVCKNYCKYVKLHVDTKFYYIRNYIESFCYEYNRNSLKYFRLRFVNSSNERNIDESCFTTPAYIKSDTLPRPMWSASHIAKTRCDYSFGMRKKDYQHQCCGMTRKGKRCSRKTYELFCCIHKNSSNTYWKI